MNPPKLSYTIKEAAQSTGLSQRFLWYAIAEGRLKSVKVGGRRLILARHLDDFLIHGGKTADSPAPVPLNQER
jgi:excisionase family DNA binding protein